MVTGTYLLLRGDLHDLPCPAGLGLLLASAKVKLTWSHSPARCPHADRSHPSTPGIRGSFPGPSQPDSKSSGLWPSWHFHRPPAAPEPRQGWQAIPHPSLGRPLSAPQGGARATWQGGWVLAPSPRTAAPQLCSHGPSAKLRPKPCRRLSLCRAFLHPRSGSYPLFPGSCVLASFTPSCPGLSSPAGTAKSSLSTLWLVKTADFTHHDNLKLSRKQQSLF